MMYLAGSIILSSWLTLAFKVLQRYGISAFEAIVYNYIVCVITGSLVNGSFPVHAETMNTGWFYWALFTGSVFIITFNITGYTAQKMGVAVASVANKLSLVIPFLFSIWMYNETAGVIKYIGIAAAVAAVILTCMPSKNNVEVQTSNKWIWLLPVVLFFGSGLIDSLVVFVQKAFFNTSAGDFNGFLITAFAMAGTIGVIILCYLYTTEKARFSVKPVLAGILIGVPNYFSIWCLGKLINEYSGNSSVAVPVNNMGIVLLSAVAAWLLFKEKLTVVNWMGIILAIIAIALIAFG